MWLEKAGLCFPKGIMLGEEDAIPSGGGRFLLLRALSAYESLLGRALLYSFLLFSPLLGEGDLLPVFLDVERFLVDGAVSDFLESCFFKDEEDERPGFLELAWRLVEDERVDFFLGFLFLLVCSMDESDDSDESDESEEDDDDEESDDSDESDESDVDDSAFFFGLYFGLCFGFDERDVEREWALLWLFPALLPRYLSSIFLAFSSGVIPVEDVLALPLLSDWALAGVGRIMMGDGGLKMRDLGRIVSLEVLP